MARGEHDRPDPSLIVEGTRRSHPSKRIQGGDYPITPLEELRERSNIKAPSTGINTTQANSSSLSINISAVASSSTQHENTHCKDISKPDGEACRDDGTLKEANEMEWCNSPTEHNNTLLQENFLEWPSSPCQSGDKRKHKQQESESEANEAPKAKRKNRQQIVISEDEGDESMPKPPTTQKATKSGLSKQKFQHHHQKQLNVANDELDGSGKGSDSEDVDEDSPEKGVATSTSGSRIDGSVRRFKDNTKDLRICGKEDKGSHPYKNTLVDGWYCKFCLKANNSKKAAFLTGNVTTRRRHLLRSHLDEYWNACMEKGITPTTPKDWAAPVGWIPPNERDVGNHGEPQQQSITLYTQKVPKPSPVPRVDKAGIQEHLLAIIATCDLPFRFVERPAVRGFITYLNHTLRDNDIPRKSAIANSVNGKEIQLEEITLEIIERIPSKVSTVWDGWSTRRRRPFTSFSISFIDSPPGNDTLWELKNHLLEFNSPVGRHTGKLIGMDLVNTTRKFHLEKKLGWMVGDGVSANDVAVRTVCRELDPGGKHLKPKQVRILCIDHSMHRAAYHFIRALGVPSMTKSKSKISQRKGPVDDGEPVDDDNDDEDDDADIDVSMAIEADADDTEAMAAITVVDYDPGDTLGKLMAFVNQLRMSSEVVREYLFRTCVLQNIKPLELLLWIRTRWGSLTHCLESTLSVQKAIDSFCLTADANDDLPPLKDKSWMDYRLTSEEWNLIRLVHDCLKVIAARHNELSSEEFPTITRVLPMLELLMSEWEDRLEKEEYEPVHDALRAGVNLLEKYYRRADDTDVYFIAHVLDPVLKLDYLNAAWEEEYLEIGMKHFKSQFLAYKAKYDASLVQGLPPVLPQNDTNLSSTDAWMESVIKKKQKKKGNTWLLSQPVPETMDKFEELNRYLRRPRLTRDECPNSVAYWGHQVDDPVLRLMARDYLAIPATSCIAERSFSLSGRTDDPRRGQLKKTKFGGLQKIRAGYLDVRLNVEEGIMRKYVGDFTFDDEMD